MPTLAGTPAHWRARMGAYGWLFALAAGVFVLDQVTKIWVTHTLPYDHPYSSITVIPGFFYLVHVGNTGAAWSMFTGMSLWLAALAVVTLAAIFIFRRHLELKRTSVQVSFGLLCGGIVGNLTDRILPPHHVIDFLLFQFWSHPFPVFNIADTAICVGVGLYLINSFRAPPQDEAATSPEPPPTR